MAWFAFAIFSLSKDLKSNVHSWSSGRRCLAQKRPSHLQSKLIMPSFVLQTWQRFFFFFFFDFFADGVGDSAWASPSASGIAGAVFVVVVVVVVAAAEEEEEDDDDDDAVGMEAVMAETRGVEGVGVKEDFDAALTKLSGP